MAGPCLTNTCTVDLALDVNGNLVANAHVAQSVEFPANGIEPIDASNPGTSVALQRQRYRMRRLSSDLAGGFMTVDNISDSQPTANPFGCAAYGLLTYEFRVRGERNDSAFTGRAAGDADFNDGETYDNAFYVRGYSQIDLVGLAPTQLIQPRSTGGPPPTQRTAIDEYGLWIPQAKGIRDQSQGSYNPATGPTNTRGPRDKIWQQSVLMKLTANQVFTVLAQIQIDEKWHFDMSTGNSDGTDPGSGRSGTQGAQLRGGSIVFWPADD